MRRMTRHWALVAVTAVFSSAASADIYKCTDDSGHVTYSNVQSGGCKRLIAEPVTTIPSPRPDKPKASATPSPEGFPKVDGGAQRARDNERRRILEDELASEQKGAEQARKELAEQEAIVLPEERNIQRGVGGQSVASINSAKVEERLKPLKDKLALHERNIEALKKEIANLK